MNHLVLVLEMLKFRTSTLKTKLKWGVLLKPSKRSSNWKTPLWTQPNNSWSKPHLSCRLTNVPFKRTISSCSLGSRSLISILIIWTLLVICSWPPSWGHFFQICLPNFIPTIMWKIVKSWKISTMNATENSALFAYEPTMRTIFLKSLKIKIGTVTIARDIVFVPGV